MDKNFSKDKVAVITGGAKKIGRSTAKKLANQGFNVLIHTGGKSIDEANHNIFYFLVKTLSATTVAAVPLGEPVISSVGAFFLFGEPVGPFVFLGGSITLIGVYIIIQNDD